MVLLTRGETERRAGQLRYADTRFMLTLCTKVLYDARKSARGAKFCVAKAPRKANALSALNAMGVASFGSADGAIMAPQVSKTTR